MNAFLVSKIKKLKKSDFGILRLWPGTGSYICYLHSFFVFICLKEQRCRYTRVSICCYQQHMHSAGHFIQDMEQTFESQPSLRHGDSRVFLPAHSLSCSFKHFRLT